MICQLPSPKCLILLDLPEGVAPGAAEEGMLGVGVGSSSSRPRFLPRPVEGPAGAGVSMSGPSGELVMSMIRFYRVWAVVHTSLCLHHCTLVVYDELPSSTKGNISQLSRKFRVV